MEDAEHPQLRAQPFGIAGQILEGLGAGGEEQIVTELGMRADPGAQRIGQGESEQEIRHGQEQPGLLAGQPGVGVGLAAERTMAVVTRVVEIAKRLATQAAKELAAPGGSAAGEDPLKHLALTRRHDGAETLPVLRSEAAQAFVEGERRGSALPHRPRFHERAA